MRAGAKDLLWLTLIVLVAVWLHFSALDAGYAADDYLQRAMLDGEYPVKRTPLDLYSFLRKPGELPVLMEGGIPPWWSHPALRLSLLRPLASLLLWLDHSVLGLGARGEHVHSFVWMVLLILAFRLLARRFLPNGGALLATAIFAFDSALVAPVSWICNRTALVSAALGAFGLVAYLRFRDDDWKPGSWVSTLFFALALAGGEYAVCALGYVAAYELFAARDAWSRRMLSACAAIVPALAYLAIHVVMHYGADGSVIYVALLDSPAAFSRGIFVRIPALLATEFVVTPGEFVYASLLTHSKDVIRTLLILAVILGFAAFTIVRAEPKTRRMLVVATAGGFFGLLPLASTIPSVRLLVIPGFGGSAVIAAMIACAFRAVRTKRSALNVIAAVAAVPLTLLHLGFAPFVTRNMSDGWNIVVGTLRNKYLSAEIDDSRVANQDLYLFNAQGEIASLIYPPYVRHERGSPMPSRWRALASALFPTQVIRLDDVTLELSVEEGTMFTDSTSQMFRDPTLAFHAGDRVQMEGLEISVEEVRGWAPTRVRYRFDSSLDDPKRLFLILENGRMRRVEMPPAGSEFVVPGTGG